MLENNIFKTKKTLESRSRSVIKDDLDHLDHKWTSESTLGKDSPQFASSFDAPWFKPLVFDH